MPKLEKPLYVSGKVILGEKVGRTIGFPTANLKVKLKPDNLKTGVYLATATIKRKKYFGLAYFEPRYIFGETRNNFEIFIYDFNKNIYGENLKVELIHFLRKPIKIKTTHQLKRQLTVDKKKGLELLKVYS